MCITLKNLLKNTTYDLANSHIYHCRLVITNLTAAQILVHGINGLLYFKANSKKEISSSLSRTGKLRKDVVSVKTSQSQDGLETY